MYSPVSIDHPNLFLTVHQSEGLDTVQLSEGYEVRNYHTFLYRRKREYPYSRYNEIRKSLADMYFDYIFDDLILYLTAPANTY